MPKLWTLHIILLLSLFFSGFSRAETLKEKVSKLVTYSIVIPEIVTERVRRDTGDSSDFFKIPDEDKLSYSLPIEDVTHLIHLDKNKGFLSEDYTRYTYDKNGNLQTSNPELQRHCHYRGFVEGVKDSLVILSTCAGLSGLIFIDNKTYVIEPITESSINEHLLYEMQQMRHKHCGTTNINPEVKHKDEPSVHGTTNYKDSLDFITEHLRKKREVLAQTYYVEFVFVVDNTRYKFMNSNATAVENQMTSMANILDVLYQQLNIRVVLVGLEIWQEQNYINVTNTAGNVLGSFVKWRENDLLPRKRNDAAHLIIGQSYGGILGMAFVSSICSPSTSGGISSFTDNDVAFVASVVAHELGHNLGMLHDNTNTSSCYGNFIMTPYATNSKVFSNCSEDFFQTLIMNGGGQCLKNIPPPSEVYTAPSCGNNILESGEECDCGTPQECQNVCCNAKTCKFMPGAYCAAGACCQNCQISVAGTPCRPAVDVCDFPEFCNGSSAFCPFDTYVMNGYPCANNTTYCYNGICQTFDYQCQQLFTSAAKKAPDTCYQIINTGGTNFGNCGPGNVKCAPQDVLCGKIQCINVDANNPPPGAFITTFNQNNVVCVNVFFDLGSDVPDPGYVHTGTGCGTGKACVNYKCTNASALGFSCDIKNNCSGNGVCDNLGNCYCNYGWAPPHCNTWGYGGSIDSGPTHIDTSVRDGLLIFFLLVVPVLSLIAILVFKRNAIKDKCCQKKSSNRYRAKTPEANRGPQTRPPPNKPSQNTVIQTSQSAAFDPSEEHTAYAPRYPPWPAAPPRPSGFNSHYEANIPT
ncbi:disintegrin and metalloproteinase domain-containing protein 9 [Erpetoichthys calabaricus]|uniref:disintegrin and metalloproteinase domain-containing protein 9 n=1 Tax=Erpetoichthys calabaricus TaxID=27687 RepID=UPI002234474C|nr:disintegrin and metalloproteinase domain-containing protein 9 [Erpetoichthys calabaricus]